MESSLQNEFFLISSTILFSRHCFIMFVTQWREWCFMEHQSRYISFSKNFTRIIREHSSGREDMGIAWGSWINISSTTLSSPRYVAWSAYNCYPACTAFKEICRTKCAGKCMYWRRYSTAWFLIRTPVDFYAKLYFGVLGDCRCDA
jgi:hypothetical protein